MARKFHIGSRVLAGVLALSAALSSGVQAAPQMDKGLYDLGSGICADIANGALSLPGTGGMIDRVDAHGWERSEFCHCVGSEFGLNPMQRARMQAAEGEAASAAMLMILQSNMSFCLPGERLYLDLITSKEDVYECRRLLDGELQPAGFDLSKARRLQKDGAHSTDRLCECAAGYLTSVEEFTGPRAGADGALTPDYEMQLATGVMHCLSDL